jgi:hypothetical protein
MIIDSGSILTMDASLLSLRDSGGTVAGGMEPLPYLSFICHNRASTLSGVIDPEQFL